MNINHAERLLRETRDFAGRAASGGRSRHVEPKVCQLLNALVRCMDPGEQYLEVGSWHGRTLLSGRIFSATSRPSFVSRAIHLAHAAGAEWREHLIRAEPGTGCQGHGESLRDCQHPERGTAMASGVHEVPAIRRNRRFFNQ
jgi:hypothetical protein